MKNVLDALGLIWRGLDQIRRALLNLLVLAVLIALAWALLKPGAPKLQDNTALHLKLSGNVVEQFSGSARERINTLVQGGQMPRQLRLRDVLQAVDEAARDPQITRLVLDVDELGSAGMSSLREIAAALTRFKATGKPVVAWAEGYTQGQYYLAAHASEVFVHPMGYVAIAGMGRHRIYYKDLFDRLGVQAHVVRAGRYKNFAEPYAANAPSAETQESDKGLYGALWGLYTEGIERARRLPPGSTMVAINKLPDLVAEAKGDAAQLALNTKLVDGLKTEDELRAHLVKSGAAVDEKKGKGNTAGSPPIRRMAWGEYLARVKPRTDGDAVAVVVAEGNIVNGEAGPGAVGGRSTAALIRAAREDAKVKAVVLRVRSPGGSAFASEQVREQLALTRAAGKPVVVSMGDLAASGGYWISQAADAVYADAATITGSIGVVGMLPSIEGAMAKLGLKTGGYSTTWIGDGYDPRRGLDPRFEQLVQQGINHAYSDFLAKVAAARKSTPEKIHEVAQGRVWTGAQAHERGLVDQVGSYQDALANARQRAKLPADARVVHFERGGGRFEKLAALFTRVAAEAMGLGPEPDHGAGVGAASAPSWMQLVPAGVQQDLSELAQMLRLAAPQGAQGRGPAVVPLAHCGCGVGP